MFVARSMSLRAATAGVSWMPGVDSLADGAEDEVEAEVEGEDCCKEGEVADVLFPH